MACMAATTLDHNADYAMQCSAVHLLESRWALAALLLPPSGRAIAPPPTSLLDGPPWPDRCTCSRLLPVACSLDFQAACVYYMSCNVQDEVERLTLHMLELRSKTYPQVQRLVQGTNELARYVKV